MRIEKGNMQRDNIASYVRLDRKDFNPIKAKYNSIEDFKKKFTFADYFPYDFMEDAPKTIVESYRSFIENIVGIYQKNDEIWHYDDFGVAPIMSSREYIMLIRDGKTIKEFMIRMS